MWLLWIATAARLHQDFTTSLLTHPFCFCVLRSVSYHVCFSESSLARSCHYSLMYSPMYSPMYGYADCMYHGMYHGMLHITKPRQPRRKLSQQNGQGKIRVRIGFSSLHFSDQESGILYPSSVIRHSATRIGQEQEAKQQNPAKNSTDDVLIGSGPISFMCALFHSGAPMGGMTSYWIRYRIRRRRW